jgi:spectrin beta
MLESLGVCLAQNVIGRCTFRFREVSELGGQLLMRNPGLVEVKERLARLTAEQDALCRGWNEKDNFLKQVQDLQLLNKEADYIDTTTSSHENFLEYTGLGVSSLSSS